MEISAIREKRGNACDVDFADGILDVDDKRDWLFLDPTPIGVLPAPSHPRHKRRGPLIDGPRGFNRRDPDC
jgi:hypothetical protein